MAAHTRMDRGITLARGWACHGSGYAGVQLAIAQRQGLMPASRCGTLAYPEAHFS